MEKESFYEDMCNIARILPTLSSYTIYTELNSLRDHSERVQIIIRKYFEEYDPKNHNCMTEDIKKIKRVLPNYPIVKISNDLLSVEDKENRVQIVVKNYFDNQNKALKRCLDSVNETDLSPGKKFKKSETLDQTDIVSNREQSSNETENYSITSEDMQPISDDIFPVSEDIQPISDGIQSVSEVIQPISEDIPPISEDIQPISEDIQPVSECIQPVSECIQPIIEQPIPQEFETNNIEVANYTEIKTIEQLAEDNSINLNTNDQISCKDSNNDCSIPDVCGEANECGITVLSVLSNLFPQYSSVVLNTICEDLGVNLHSEASDITIDLVVNVLLNYGSNVNKFEQDKSEACKNQPSVLTGSVQLSNYCSTSAILCEDKEKVADSDETSQKSSTQDYSLELENYLKETVENFLSNINTADKKDDVQTSLICEERTQTAEDVKPGNIDLLSNINIHPNSTSGKSPSIENLSPLLPSSGSTVITKKIGDNIESSSLDKLSSTSSVINYSYTELDRNRYDAILNLPSTSTNNSELSSVGSSFSNLENNSSMNNNTFKLRNELNATPQVLNSDIDPRLFSNARVSSTSNNLQPTLQMATKQTVSSSRSNSIIKPATFHPASSSKYSTKSLSNIVRTDLGSVTRTNVKIKPASFNPTSNKTAISTGTNKTRTHTSLNINSSNTDNKCGSSRKLSETYSNLSSKKNQNLPKSNTLTTAKKEISTKTYPLYIAADSKNLKQSTNLNATRSNTTKHLAVSNISIIPVLPGLSNDNIKQLPTYTIVDSANLEETFSTRNMTTSKISINVSTDDKKKNIKQLPVNVNNPNLEQNLNASCSKTTKNVSTSKNYLKLVSNISTNDKKKKINQLPVNANNPNLEQNLNASCSKTTKNVSTSKNYLKLVSNISTNDKKKKINQLPVNANNPNLEQNLNASCSKTTKNVSTSKNSLNRVSNISAEINNKIIKQYLYLDEDVTVSNQNFEQSANSKTT